MKTQNYEIKSEWGVIARGKNRDGAETEVRLTKCAWFGKPEKWDIRKWTGDFAGPGVTMTDAEIKTLRDLLNSIEVE